MHFVLQSTFREWIKETVPLAKKLWYKALLISVPGIFVFVQRF